MSDCNEIYGRTNDLGGSPEMILSQKSDMRPEMFGNVARVLRSLYPEAASGCLIRLVIAGVL